MFVTDADTTEHILREISRLEEDIRELREYKSELRAQDATLRGRERLKHIFRNLMVVKQIDWQLRYSRVKLETAQDVLAARRAAEEANPDAEPA
jgi:hypothetical protein